MNRCLVQASADTIDYVITHEPCHVAEPHHGAAFFELLDILMSHRDGALVSRALRLNPATKSFLPDPMPVFSHRTYFAALMLGSRDLERMAGLRVSREATTSVEDAPYILASVQGNA